MWNNRKNFKINKTEFSIEGGWSFEDWTLINFTLLSKEGASVINVINLELLGFYFSVFTDY